MRKNLQGTLLERLMWRGRWQAISIFRRYVKEASSVMALGRLPEQVASNLPCLSQNLAAVMGAFNLSWPELERMMSLC